MKDFFKNKVVTALIVTATLILAGVAVFTAVRLYQLRRQAVAPTSPESQPFAWDCSSYTFSVDNNGLVTVNNQSQRDEASQQAKVYINGDLVSTFDVPTLPHGQSANLGSVILPSGQFSWKVVGTKDCQNEGTGTSGPKSCELLTFTLTQLSPTPTEPGPSSTPTNTPTSTPTSTPTNTPVPSGTPSPTATPTEPGRGGEPSPTPTPTLTSAPNPTTTPTAAEIAAASPTPGGANLPAAGVGSPTIILGFIAILIITASMVVAL
jgi:hypothetical protein